MRTEKVLLVDDDVNILAAYERQLRKQFQIETSAGSEQALEALNSRGPFAVIVTDMRMPGRNGIELLSKVREIAPETVRMMLTGNADLKVAIDAVREGNVFRFLTKPCPPTVLVSSLQAGLEQYRLVTAEKELLEKTLSGCIKILTEILSMVDPESFGRAMVIRDNVRLLAKALRVQNAWEIEVSAMLSPIGHVTIPSSVAAKARLQQALTREEEEMLARAPEIGRNLLVHVPRLESVAQIILYQNKRFDGSGFPQDSVSGENIPLGARILKVVGDLFQIKSGDLSTDSALQHLRTRAGWYDPKVLEAALNGLASSAAGLASGKRTLVGVATKELLIGQVLVSDVETREGKLLIAAGNRITETLLERIRNCSKLTAIKEPIYVEDLPPVEKRGLG